MVDIIGMIAKDPLENKCSCPTDKMPKRKRYSVDMKQETCTWLTADEAAQHLKVSKAAIRKWTRFGKIPHHIVGPGNKTVRYEMTELDRWVIEKQK